MNPIPSSRPPVTVRPDTQPTPLEGLARPMRARLAVVSLVYHQAASGAGAGQPSVQEARYSRLLQTDEQPYLRRLTVTEEWAALDTGWLDGRVGLLVLKNEEQRGKEGVLKVIELCPIAPTIRINDLPAESFCWLIEPGEIHLGQPRAAASLFLRCVGGPAKLTVMVLPH